jgi:hypothetical protein
MIRFIKKLGDKRNSKCTCNGFWETTSGGMTSLWVLKETGLFFAVWPLSIVEPGVLFPKGGVPSNPEFDDWSRVFTTSRGQVMIAPVVPPTLERYQRFIELLTNLRNINTYPPATNCIKVSIELSSMTNSRRPVDLPDSPLKNHWWST